MRFLRSIVRHIYTTGVLPSCILNVQCLLIYNLDYCHKTHDRACGFSATASGVAPARPKMLSIALVYVHCWASGAGYRNFYIFHRSAMAKRKAGSLKVQRSPILQPCVSKFYARLRFSATHDTTSSTDNHCPAALQRCQGLLNGTLYGYLRVRHRPAMCVSLSMNASCCASVLPSTHDYAYRACDTSTAASRIAPARPKMLSIALVYIHGCVPSLLS